MKVFTKNEYSTLKSVIVGSAKKLSWPTDDPAFDRAVESINIEEQLIRGNLPIDIENETEQDLEVLVRTLEKYNIQVHRPVINEPNWSYSARDILLSVGNKIIECPTQYSSRRDEAKFYQHLKKSAIEDGCTWIKAPEPLSENDPMFDAANICKFNDKLLYLVSSTGNIAGAEWLQDQVGTDFEVIKWEGVYSSAHIDSTVASLNKNTIILNASRVSYNNLPLFLRSYRKIWVNDIISRNFTQFPFASKWIGMNVLSIDPETVVIDKIQKKLIEMLKEEKFQVVELELRHSRTLGGGFHCVTCDLERLNDD